MANVAEHLHRLPIPPVFVTVKERGEGFAEVAEAVLANLNHGDRR
jgi:hypothetical protein